MKDISDQEYELFCKKIDEVLDIMKDKALKEGWIFYGAWTVRHKENPYLPWYGWRTGGEATAIDVISLIESMKQHNVLLDSSK